MSLLDRRPQFTHRRVALIVVLAAVWCGLWKEPSLANILSGIVLAFVATTPTMLSISNRPINYLALVRCLLLVAVDLVKSTWTVVYEVLTPTDYTEECTIEVHVGPTGMQHLLLLVVSVTLTPGTAVVDIDKESGALLLHLLHADNEPDVRLQVARLVELAEQAFPSAVAAGSHPESHPESNRTTT